MTWSGKWTAGWTRGATTGATAAGTIRRPRLLTLLAFLGALAVPGEAAAHEELRAAEPADGDSLSVAPAALRLTFVNPVRLSFARLSLLGPDGPVSLGKLRQASGAASILVGPIEGALVAGTYTVRWQVAGPDGHPVRGEYAFTLRSDAEGLAPPDAQRDSLRLDTAAMPPGAGNDEGGRAVDDPVGAAASAFDSGSPLYVAVRWLTFLALLGAIGAVAFRLAVLPRLEPDAAAGGLVAAAARRGAVVGGAAAALLLLAALLRLYAQSWALNGPAEALSPERLGAVLSEGDWALGWWLQALGALAAISGFAWAARSGRRSRAGAAPDAGWIAAALAVLVLAFTPAFSGHASAIGELKAAAILGDGLHVLGAGGWLGTLLLVLVAGVPAAVRRPDGRGPAVAALVNAFSPIALVFAVLVVLTGALSAWLHLGTPSALWTSGYGRVLLAKLGAVGLVAAAGAYNWRRARPRLGDLPAARRLTRSAALELAMAVVVLVITAVLVATPPPGDALTP